MFEYLKETFEYTKEGQLYGVWFELTELGKDIVYSEHELNPDVYKEKDYHSVEKVWYELFEYQSGNGWMYIPEYSYEKLNYLTDNSYIITDCDKDVFYYSDYMIHSVMTDIVENGKVFFHAMQYTSQEMKEMLGILNEEWGIENL